ncbi:PRoMiNin (5-transmembrane domain glycoprotein) [Trichostrongylus colubriformis]|uniref:PRoMiNin (5-transmembrane domain glycoprotein) n=1 Tax=Trichostrongylus colubriformis TaxID=6319 RepID=A0AAN8I8U8_TRICO
MAILVLIDVFAAATLLITGQYAEYGLDELPNRLNYCIDDLNLYKRDTDARIRKILIDDYQMLNRTVSSQLAYAGHEVVQGVKRFTGANTIDALMNLSRSAEEIDQMMKDTRIQMKEIVDGYSKFEVQYGRMQSTSATELRECLQNEVESLKAICHKAEKILDTIAPQQLNIDVNGIWSTIENTLDQIRNANIPQSLSTTVQKFKDMEKKIQVEVDKKLHSSQAIMQQISDDLFYVAENFSEKIRRVNFDRLYDVVTRASDPKESIAAKFVQYSKWVSLVITSVFLLISLCFLLGLFYGICGRRPTFYNDDCCVRSTGGRFYSCGIWLTIFTFTVLSVITASLFLIVGNTSDIVCRTLRDPLSRNDIIKLGERYLDIMRSKEQVNDDLVSMMHEHSLADLIRACQRNETLYEVFQLDKKYQLKRLKSFEKEQYDKLARFLNITLTDLPLIKPMNNMIAGNDFDRLQKLAEQLNNSQSRRFALSEINSSLSNLDIQSRLEAFESRIGSGTSRPKEVAQMLDRIKTVDTQYAKPLRIKLGSLLKNLTRLNKKLEEIEMPTSTLLSKLQHAQALLSENLPSNLQKAANELLEAIFANINQYVDHVKNQMQHDISSCTPIAAIISSSTAALCDYTVDPLNGAWMSMLICLLCLVPMLVFATALVNLYKKMHSFPKYVVETPPDHHQLSSFITDTYETRQKPGYTNYSYTDNYHRTFR